MQRFSLNLCLKTPFQKLFFLQNNQNISKEVLPKQITFFCSKEFSTKETNTKVHSNKPSIWIQSTKSSFQESASSNVQNSIKLEEITHNKVPFSHPLESKLTNLPKNIVWTFIKIFKIQEEKKNKENVLFERDLRKYLNFFLSSITLYKDLQVSKKTKAHIDMRSLMKEFDYKLLKVSILNVVSSDHEKQRDKILNLLFNIFSNCLSQNLHSSEIYNNLVGPLLTPNIIFQFHYAKRFPVALMYMTKYEKGYDQSPSYTNLLNFFLEANNFQHIILNASENELLSLMGNLSLNKLTPQCKLLFIQEITKRIKAQSWSNDSLLKFFALLSEHDTFIQMTQDFAYWETKTLDIDFNKVDKKVLVLCLVNLKGIYSNSKKVYNKLLNFITQSPTFLVEETLTLIIMNSENINFPQYFLEFLNNQVKGMYRNGILSISFLSAFIYQLVRKKKLDLDLFKNLENYILENIHKCAWSPIDLHHILWSCHILTFDSSPLFQKLEDKVHMKLQNLNLETKTFGILTWDISRATYMIKFEVFQTILKKLEQNFQSFEKDINNLATLLYSISLLLARYSTFDENFTNVYKNRIHKEILQISHFLKNLCDKKDIFNENIETQAKIFQFLLTLRFEFPNALEGWEEANNFITQFETKPFNPRLISSNLSIDVENVLKKMEIEYQIEYRAYIYFIDVFIKPNIALQIEGVRHYTKETRSERHQDLLRDYHLKKLGYKVIKIPFYEFSKIFFTDFKKQKEYIQNIIYST